jgi:hypothetical protein
MPHESQRTPETDRLDAASETRPSRALTIFSSPRVALLGTLLGTVGIVLSVYFYLESREYPELTYYVHPVKASVLKAGQASKLQCNFEGQLIASDITVSQIALWNQGKRSIKRNNILKPIVLYATNAAAILEVTLRKQSRDVVNIELDRSELQKGRLLISWAILEQNDGAIIQLTYAGGSDVSMVLDGVVEGQGNPRRVDYAGKFESPEEQYRSRTSSDRTFRWFMLGIGTFAITISLLMLKRRSPSDRVGRALVFATLAWGCLALVFFAMSIYQSRLLGPPFGFD